MIAMKTDPRPGRGGWLPLILAGALYAIVVCVIIAVRAESTSDFRDFWETGLHFRHTGQISSELGVHNYLPFFTLFMTPWSLLPLRLAAVLFTLLSLGLLALTVALVEALLNGGLGPRPRPATIMALLLVTPYVHSCVVLGQVGLLVLLLVVATWFLVERGEQWAAGVALGLAALIKILPALLIVFFLLKGRWRVGLTALATILLLGAGLPLAAVGYKTTVAQHVAYYDRAVAGHSAKATIFAEKPQKAKYSNNALPIVLRRLLSHVSGDPSDKQPDRSLYVNFADLSRPAIWRIYVALLAIFGVVGVGVSLRRSRPWPPEDPAPLPEKAGGIARRAEGPPAALTVRAQFGVWCCLMLIASPLLWTHYLVLAYWPLAVVADNAERTKREQGRPCPGCVLAMTLWLIGALLLAWPAARSAGAQLWSVAALGVIVAIVSLDDRPRAAPRALN